MPVAFIASLRTTRTLERGVSFHGATQSSVEKEARTWLDAFGENGDSFCVVENVPTERAVIACDKPVAPEPERKLKGHGFMSDPKQPLKCRVCGSEKGEHW